MIKQIRNAKSVQSKAKKNIVHPMPSTSSGTADREPVERYQVVSASSGNVYNVRVHGECATCDCNWGAYRPATDKRSGCSHVIATFGFIAEENGRKVSVWNSAEDADRQHRPMLSIGNGVVLTSRAA